MAPRFHTLTVSDVRRLTAEAVAVSFDLPEELANEYAFTPGQYVTLAAELDGEEVRRNYSIASAPGEPLTVGIKRVEGGRFSTFAQGLARGDRLRVMTPEGRFTWRGERNILLVAAGSGITPMLSIAAAALESGAEVALVYGNRTSGSIMFLEELEALKDRHLGRFSLIHVLSREEQDVPILHGRIDADRIRRLARAGAIDPAGAEAVFLCGPGGMIDSVAAGLEADGIAPERIRTERFLLEGEAPRAAPSEAAREAAREGVAVEVILDGRRRRFTVAEGDDSVLAAAEREGLELPYSCRAGMCCTCRCKLLEGEVEMAVNYSLEDWEIAAGYRLACQARPTSRKLVLDFDVA